MPSTTSILLRQFRFALARHGKTVRLTTLRAGGRGNYIAAEGKRDAGEASYDLDVLEGMGMSGAIGTGTGSTSTKVFACLLVDLPLVEQAREVPCKGWLITEVLDPTADVLKEVTYSVTEAEPAYGGHVRKLTGVRKK